MRRLALAALLAIACARHAAALTLEDPRIDATPVANSTKDPFRIRARLAGVDLTAIATGPLTVRFGDLRQHIAAGGMQLRGKKAKWRGYLGVKKVTLNVKKSTIDIRGGGQEIGDLETPLTLALVTSEGAMCGEVTWGPRARKGKGRRSAVLPLAPCPAAAAVSTGPQVMITTPSSQDGISIGAPAVSLGGAASDDTGIVAMSWTSDRGGGGALTPAATWSLPDVPLQPGDNRITVTAVDGDGQSASDTLDVTFNENGLAFSGPPLATPGYLFTGAPRALTVRVGLVPDPDLDRASVEIYRLDDDGVPVLVKGMSDDGDRTTGDLIAGDGFFAALVSVSSPLPDVQRFRVAAHTLSEPGLTAWSPVLEVRTLAHVDIDAVTAATALADDAGAMLARFAARGLTAADALDDLLALGRTWDVETLGLSDGGRGVWWVTADGLLGAAFGHDPSQRGSAPSPATPAAATRPAAAATPAALPADPVEVGSRRALVFAPYFAEDEPSEIAAMLEARECPTFPVDAYLDGAAGAERLKDLENYGTVVIASHADAFFGGIGASYRPQWHWSAPGSQVALLTATRIDRSTLPTWEGDLLLGRIAIMPGGAAAVLPGFLAAYTVGLPGSLVYVGACNSTANPTLAQAFFGLGAATVLGYDGYVDSAFARDVSVDLVSALLDGQSVGDAFVPGQSDGDDTPATFTLLGSTQTGFATRPIANASFEFSSGTIASVTGFDVTGDGRVVGALGTWLPTDGVRMAQISTGLGLTKESGIFSQTVCLPSLPTGATSLKLEYDWNFFSEEFIEYCGSAYQDSFEVSFGTTKLQSTKVDDLCDVVVPDPIAFDQGDVWTTGWLTQSVDVTPFAGTTALLKFAAKDVGDSIYDTVILVDRLRLVPE